jgi:hypothetical protein
VKQPRRHFLADAGGAGDEHPASRAGDPLQSRAHRVDRNARSREFRLLPDLSAQSLILAPQPVGLGGAGDEVEEVPRLERLFDEVDRSLPDRGDGRVEMPWPEIISTGSVGSRRLDLLEHLEPVELRS